MKFKIVKKLLSGGLAVILATMMLGGGASAMTPAEKNAQYGSVIMPLGGLSPITSAKWRYFVNNATNNMYIQYTNLPQAMALMYQFGSGTTSNWHIRATEVGGTPYFFNITSNGGNGTPGFTVEPGNKYVGHLSPNFETQAGYGTVGNLLSDVSVSLKPVNNEKMMQIGLTVKNTTSIPLMIEGKAYMDTELSYGGTRDDYIPLWVTPKNNALIARKKPGTLQNYQYIVYYKDSPNITNADHWWAGVWGGSEMSVFDSGLTAGQGMEAGGPYAPYTQMTSGSYDSALALWYNPVRVEPGESVSFYYAVGLSTWNNPPVLETLLPDVPQFFNRAVSDQGEIILSGTWYDEDSASVDLYRVIDLGTPEKYGGASIPNAPGPGFSGPSSLQPFGPINYPVDIRTTTIDQHRIDYYLEDPQEGVSNQLSVFYYVYDLLLRTNRFQPSADYKSATLFGDLERFDLGNVGEIVETGFVYKKLAGGYEPKFPNISDDQHVVSNNWNKNKPFDEFSATVNNLDPLDDYLYRSYAKVKWPGNAYSYEYAIPKIFTTWPMATPKPESELQSILKPADGGGPNQTIVGGNGKPLVPGTGVGTKPPSGIISGGSTNKSGSTNTDTSSGLTSGGDLGSAGFAAPQVPYTPSPTTKTAKPKTTKAPSSATITEETVDELTEEMPLTGQGVIVAVAVTAIVAAVALFVLTKKKKNQK